MNIFYWYYDCYNGHWYKNLKDLPENIAKGANIVYVLKDTSQAIELEKTETCQTL